MRFAGLCGGILAVVLALLPSTVAHAEKQSPATSLDASEKRLLAAIDGRQPAALALLERVVNINSGTMNFAGVRAVGDIFAEELQDIGFNTQWVDGEAFGRAGHLVASYGNSGPKLLLIGHLDTVFAADSEFQQFQRIDVDSASGPGTTDMKGGDVIMLLALAALKEVGALDALQLKVVMTGDEEHRGYPRELANAALIEAAHWADYALGFEDADSNPSTAVTARRGAASWTLQVSGKAAHSSQVFSESEGYGAIYEAARILNNFRETLEKESKLTFNPGLLVAGTDITVDDVSKRGTAFGKDNVIAQSAFVAGDIRALSPQQLRAAQSAMQKIVDENLPQTKAEIRFSEGYPPMPASDGNRKLLQLYSAVSEDLGTGVVSEVDPRNAGAADISFTAAHVVAAIDGLGLMGSGGHTVEEVADLRTLSSQAQRAAVLMYRLSAGAFDGRETAAR